MPAYHEPDRGHRVSRTRRRRGALLAFACGCALLPACSSGPPQRGVVVRADNLSTVFEAGMAVAPLTALDARQRASEVTERMTEELFATLFASGGGAPLVSPEDVQAMLEGGGTANLQYYEAFRTRLAAGERPDQEEFVRLSRMVQHRFLFVAWYDESTSVGVETGAGDPREEGYATGVSNTAFSQVIGRIEARVLDLWEGEVLWHAIEEYRTERLYGARAEVEAEIERARVDGAARVAGRFAAP